MSLEVKWGTQHSYKSVRIWKSNDTVTVTTEYRVAAAYEADIGGLFDVGTSIGCQI